MVKTLQKSSSDDGGPLPRSSSLFREFGSDYSNTKPRFKTQTEVEENLLVDVVTADDR